MGRGEMINKNLRRVLYYVTGVTIVCLMIEFSKRVPAGGLDSRLYVVETAKESELASLPKRDRGRVKSTKQPRKLEEPESIENTIKDTRTNREKFKEWKASVKISEDEMGLFKKWKFEQGLSKKQLKEKETLSEKEEDVTEETQKEEDDDPELADEVKSHEPSTDEKVEKEYADADNNIDTEELIDYPEGIDEYEPPNLDHSCSVRS